jgi:exonuclease SbcC
MLRTAMTVDPERASARLRDVEDEVTALRAAVAEAEEARVRHREGQTRLRELDEQLTQARIQAEQQQAALLAAQEKVRAAEMAVSAARDGHPSVAARLQALAARQQALVMARAAEDELSHARRAARQTESILADTLAGVGLPDAQSAEAAILDESVADEYQKTVEQFDAETRTVAGALQDLVGIDLEVAPDLQALEHAVDERRMASEAAQKELGRLQHTLGEAVPLREQVRARAQEHNRVRDETAGVIRMADLATASRGEGIHRVKLSAFVLMRRFESVVEAANDRLDAISDGRYQLKVEHKGLDNRGQHGLDLVVEDQRTERCRPTKSLSGGESFYVSLALALGLADVVRSESGGVSLGTLFIDEGFGSLDSEVLEEVIDMLEQVRAGEDRVIGLVSHVEILKQRIDPRISVRRDPQRAGVSTLEVSV